MSRRFVLDLWLTCSQLNVRIKPCAVTLFKIVCGNAEDVPHYSIVFNSHVSL